jgi:hypothetical protein
MLSYGSRDTRWCLVLPARHKAVTNVYDFSIYPVMQKQPVRAAEQKYTPYHYVYTYGRDLAITAQPRDTLCFVYMIQDTSRLDSTLFRGGINQDLAAGVNRVQVSAAYIPAYEGAPGPPPRVELIRDVNRDYCYDPGDMPLNRGEPVALAPGEQLIALAVVAIPASYRFACSDTVRLVCASQRSSPSGEHLTRVVNRVLSVQDRGLLQALAPAARIRKKW